ncbi:MAG TPA: hypothetical protein DDY34_11880 [Bacteroidales bacterium]|nr:hypothetical protein [Bacteroidales bacterium]
MLLRYYNLKGFYLFVGIVTANIVLVWISRTVLINEIVFYNTYSEQLTYERSLQVFESMQRFSWLSYVVIPLILLLKFTLISIVLYTAIFFFSTNDKIEFGSVFKIVVASEIVFIAVSIIKLLWFSIFGGNYDLNDLGFFYPLSLINLFDISEVNKIWIYPLQIVNLFQIVYILFISWALKNVCKIVDSLSDKIVLSSYLPALLIWIVLIMFITLETAV